MARQDQVIDFLVEQREIDVDTAKEIRASHGEQAGTRLPIEGMIDEEKLLQQLAVFYDIPPAGYQDGLFVERRVFDKLDGETTRKYEVLPVRQRGEDRVDVIVVEPLNDIARRILEDQFDTPIRQYVWPRLRFLQARHFFYGDELPTWIRPYLQEHPVTFGYATPEGEIDVHQALAGSQSLHVHQWSRNDVFGFIDECFDRDTLLKVLLGYGGRWLKNRLIVVFGKQGTQPYFVEDWPELSTRFDDVKQLRKLHIEGDPGDPLRTESSWQNGDADQLGLTPLFEQLEVDEPELLVALPIQIGSRNAMSLVGVPTDSSAAIRLEHLPDDFDIDPLLEATDRIGSQLELMIKKAKAETLPPPADRIPPLPEPSIQVGLGIEDSLVEQKIARRQKNQQRHRWEIVDISHVIEESSVAEEIDESDDEAPSGENDVSEANDEQPTPDPDDVSEATDEQPSPDSDDVSEATDQEPSPDQDDVSEPTDEDGPGHEDTPSSDEVAGVVADALNSVDDYDDVAESSEPIDADSDVENGFDDADVGSTSYGMPTIDEELAIDGESSSAADEADDSGDATSDQSSASDPEEIADDGLADPSSGWSEVLEEVSQHEESSTKDQDQVGAGQSDAVVPPETSSRPGAKVEGDPGSANETPPPKAVSVDDPPSSDAVVDETTDHSETGPSTGESFRTEQPDPDPDIASDSPADPSETHAPYSEALEESDTSDGGDETVESPTGLNIPTDSSGVPMAQILRRPPGLVDGAESTGPSEISEVSDDSLDADHSVVGDGSSNESELGEPITGRTMMGVGEISALDESSNPEAETDEDDESSDLADEESWLDNIENQQEGMAADSRPGGTVQMDADSARTQTFGELLDDMESEEVEDVPDSREVDRPMTVPVDVLEEVDTGPMAVEVEESLALLDDPDQQKAFAAAEHLATAGASVLPKLAPRFPGRLFVDRYQYTIETMPPVNEHGAVLEALVRIGESSLAVVDKYIDDTSLECRFYATYLLTELPAYALLDALGKRLFDRDQQTRTLAQNITYAHRHVEDFEATVIDPLRGVLEEADDDFRIEQAADNLRRFSDISAVPLLIERLQGHGERVQNTVHQALREITFQSLAPSPSEWRRWWFDADGQPRWQWLVEAMDSEDDDIRFLAFDEIGQLPGVELDYHPDQPSKLRARAQSQLTEIFENQAT